MLSKKGASILGMLICIAMVIVGIVIMSGDTGTSARSTRFGADYYTYQYEVTAKAVDNLRDLIKTVNKIGGWLLILLGLAGEALFTGKVWEANHAAKELELKDRMNADSR